MKSIKNIFSGNGKEFLSTNKLHINIKNNKGKINHYFGKEIRFEPISCYTDGEHFYLCFKQKGIDSIAYTVGLYDYDAGVFLSGNKSIKELEKDESGIYSIISEEYRMTAFENQGIKLSAFSGNKEVYNETLYCPIKILYIKDFYIEENQFVITIESMGIEHCNVTVTNTKNEDCVFGEYDPEHPEELYQEEIYIPLGDMEIDKNNYSIKVAIADVDVDTDGNEFYKKEMVYSVTASVSGSHTDIEDEEETIIIPQ